MSIQNAYNEWSEIYDSNQNLTRDLDQMLTRKAFAGQHFDSILETGCGTGKNTEFLVQIGGQVHALDFSQGMIEKAKEKVKADFRVYSSIEESMADHAKFLKENPRYAEAFKTKDPKAFLEAVGKAGYATGEKYVASAWGVVEKYSSLVG
jgi:SAM-dependent methyltransferase